MDRRDFLKLTCAGAGAAALGGSGCVFTKPQRSGNQSRTGRPNVILIMTDDQGYGDLGVTGNPILRTPHIDAMARRSAEMKTFYVSPVCSPTRACLMTGRYNYRTRVVDTWLARSMMEPSEITLAELLREAGYATGIFGKWHLGDNFPLRPTEQGFERSVVHRGGGIGQPADPPGGEGKYTDPILFDNNEPKQYEGYCTDIYFDEALNWIDNCHGQDKNFFAYIPTNAPHSPFHDVPQELYEDYAARDLGNEHTPSQGHALPDEVDVDRRARIFSMITNIDDNVGRLFERLQAKGLTENTLVIFMVDNGPNTRRYVAGMRGRKTEVYEGGIRTPFYMHWPAGLEAGASSDRVAAHIDVLPTILDACGIPVPQGHQLDGRSIMPLLTQEKTAWQDRTLYIQSHRGDQPFRYHNFAARNQNWKLLHASGFGGERFEGEPKFELYDMQNDPLEMTDVAADNPEVLAAMIAGYDAWFDDVGATRPDNYSPPKIHVGSLSENPVTLTRQDWHPLSGGSWAPNSNGYWGLRILRPGTYDVRLRFPATEVKGVARLKIGDTSHSSRLEAGATECVFNGIWFPLQDLKLQGELVLGKVIKGPLQVDLFW